MENVDSALKKTMVSYLLQKVSVESWNYSNFEMKKWGFGSKIPKIIQSWPSIAHLKDFLMRKSNLITISSNSKAKSTKIAVKVLRNWS